MATLRLLLDLGDCFTKAVAIGKPGRWRLRFPSVVAHRLATSAAGSEALVLGDADVPRPFDFDARQFPRGRSYPDAEPLLDSASPIARTRFAGWIAAAYGEDRELLGQHPTAENVAALVHKALLACAAGHDRAEVTFVVDLGPKVAAVQQHVGGAPRSIELASWRVRARSPRRFRLELNATLVDAPACARAALPPEVVPGQRPLLLVDIGYLRTKLAIVSPAGCERYEELPGAGMAACVARILRDGQAMGLVEDELAVVRALERGQEAIAVEGRRFDVHDVLATVQDEVEREIARAALRLVQDHFGRRGDACGGVAILGGGSIRLGPGVAARIAEENLGLGAPWVAPDPNAFLLEGAARLAP